MLLTWAANGGVPRRVLLLGGSSEIGLAIVAALAAPPETELLLAGRDQAALVAAGVALPYKVETYHYDALETAAHDVFADRVFARGPVDLVISAAGGLIPQPELDTDPWLAAKLIGTNFTGHVTTLLACADRMRAPPCWAGAPGPPAPRPRSGPRRPRRPEKGYAAPTSLIAGSGRVTQARSAVGIRISAPNTRLHSTIVP